MKKLVLIILSMGVVITARAQSDSLQLGKNILEAIKSGKIENLQKLIAPPEVYRQKFKEVATLTDEQLIEKTAGSVKLKSDFEVLLNDARAKNVDLNTVSFDSLIVENPWGSDYAPWGMTIWFSQGSKRSFSMAVSVLHHQGLWYFMEILLPTKVFKD